MAGSIESYRDLMAWQHAVEVSVRLYQTTQRFPSDERFGITNQIRRAGVAIASNIAEGYGRGTPADYLRFLRMARGSLFEVETQLLIAVRLGYVNEDTYNELEQLLKECGKTLAGLIRSIDRVLQ